MTTQVIFKMDKALKKKAMRKAHLEGIPFSSVLKLAANAYVAGALDVQLIAPAPKLNPKTQKLLTQELKEIKKNKNVSPAFTNAKESIHFLRGL